MVTARAQLLLSATWPTLLRVLGHQTYLTMVSNML